MQLQPHFFFNALHTISSLILTDVATAQRVIAALGDLLRSSIDHTARQEITLREELTFVRRYVDIQQARFRNRLDVQIDVPESVSEALVPSLVLQPLVENAIRHGIEPHTRGLYVNEFGPGDAARLSTTYGVNFDRLVALKSKVDPNNLFRMNANITPA